MRSFIDRDTWSFLDSNVSQEIVMFERPLGKLMFVWPEEGGEVRWNDAAEFATNHRSDPIIHHGPVVSLERVQSTHIPPHWTRHEKAGPWLVDWIAQCRDCQIMMDYWQAC